jgi:type I restriction enzyme, S subunit
MINKLSISQQFKDSPFGKIPDDWEVRTLKDCCLIKGEYGINAAAVEYSEELPTYVRITDIDDDGNYNGLKKVSVIDENSGNFLLQAGDIVFARTGATVGKTYLYDSKDGVLVFAGFLIRFRPNEKFLIPQHLKHFTSTNQYWNWVKTVSMRSGQPGINAEEYGSIKILLPPLPEQKAIAHVLGLMDSAINTNNRLIAQKEQQKKWLMQNLLTGKRRLNGHGVKWSFIRFKEIYSQIKEKAGSKKLLVLSVTKDGIVSQAEYFNKEIASEDTSPYLVMKKGDMVMSGLNFWMGSIDVLTQFEAGMVSPAYKVFEIINKDISPNFMKFFVRSRVMLKALKGSSVIGASVVRRNLDRETLEEWTFHLPPLVEQIAIAQVLQAADKEIQFLKAKTEKLREQKKGLMQVLLTGKKRLII